MPIIVLTFKDETYELLRYVKKVSANDVRGYYEKFFSDHSVVSSHFFEYPVIENKDLNDPSSSKTITMLQRSKNSTILGTVETNFLFQKSLNESNVWYQYELKKLSQEIHEDIQDQEKDITILNQKMKSLMDQRGFYFYGVGKTEDSDKLPYNVFLRKPSYGKEIIKVIVYLSGKRRGKFQFSYAIPTPTKAILMNTLTSSEKGDFLNEVEFNEVYENFREQVEVLHAYINEDWRK